MFTSLIKMKHESFVKLWVTPMNLTSKTISLSHANTSKPEMLPLKRLELLPLPNKTNPNLSPKLNLNLEISLLPLNKQRKMFRLNKHD